MPKMFREVQEKEEVFCNLQQSKDWYGVKR
jgi:hypothetical protein